MQELVERLKEKCTGLFIEARNDFNPNFGIEGFESSKHIWLCSPDVNYSKFSFDYLGLPKPLKILVSDANSFYDQFGIDGLHVFHYPINMKKVKKKLKKKTKKKSLNQKKIQKIKIKKTLINY